MSSFIMGVKDPKSGRIHEILCHDNYYGRHKYGYRLNVEDSPYMTEKEFCERYELEE